MNVRKHLTILTVAASLACVTAVATAEEAKPSKKEKAAAGSPLIGKWNLVVDTGDHKHPAWLAVELEKGKTVGRFLGGAGSVGGIGAVKVDDKKIEFNAHGFIWTGELVKPNRIEGKRVHGHDEDNKGTWVATRSIHSSNVSGKWMLRVHGEYQNNPPVLEVTQKVDVPTKQHAAIGADKISGKLHAGGKAIEITKPSLKASLFSFYVIGDQGATSYALAVKGDILEGMMMQGSSKHLVTAYRQREWGDPIELFNGKDLDNWKPLGNEDKYHWKVIDGIMTNTGGGGSANIVSKEKFWSFRARVEFRVPEGGNSGFYIRGRHEVQISDSYGHMQSGGTCGALYSRLVPNFNACTAPGTWQRYDITVIDYHLTVVHNGRVIIDNLEMEGITGGMIDSNESEPGPIYLQGDHGAIEYRKITIWPAR
jgi:hypothetical protein